MTASVTKGRLMDAATVRTLRLHRHRATRRRNMRPKQLLAGTGRHDHTGHCVLRAGLQLRERIRCRLKRGGANVRDHVRVLYRAKRVVSRVRSASVAFSERPHPEVVLVRISISRGSDGAGSSSGTGCSRLSPGLRAWCAADVGRRRGCGAAVRPRSATAWSRSRVVHDQARPGRHPRAHPTGPGDFATPHMVATFMCRPSANAISTSGPGSGLERHRFRRRRKQRHDHHRPVILP